MDLTAPVVFKAAWAWVLRTYLNSDDVVFGVLSSGRDIMIQIPGVQMIVGPMASMLPMRARIPRGSTAIELCRRIQGDGIEHLSHQAISLAKIQHAIKRGDEPLFNTILNIQKSGGASPPRGPTSLQFELLYACDTSEYDVALSITGQLGGYKLSMEYPTRFTSPVEATGLLEVFQKAVLQIITEPKGIISATSITTSRDRAQIQKWNAQTWDTEDRLLHKLIQETVAEQPSRPAIWSWDGQLTYSELGEMSTTLARQLRFLGCGLGSIVVLCFEKSLWAVVSMLAVAKAGAGFVHIDPNGPVERIKNIIQQTASTLGLWSAKNAARISSMLQTTLTTSRVLQFTSYCFDASLEEIFTVLLAGGCICIPSEQDRLSDIPGFVRRARVNWVAFTPSFLRTMTPSDVPSIKFITVHAEPMNGSLMKQWTDTVRMRPSYGPTECSVTSTVGAAFTSDSDAANIGWPVGCRGWVVDPNNHEILLPVGAIGELLLDGPIVGKGYLGDPEKTAASFIAPPAWSFDPELQVFDADPDRRLYKTGDLVRYMADGSLVILSRKDHSLVKVRGQRVEIQEIQHVLDRCPQILHSILGDTSRSARSLSLECLSAEILPVQEDGDKSRVRLASRSLLKADLAGEIAQNLQNTQDILSKALPAYMIPEDWLVVETMPVQVSHKLDRHGILKWVESIDEVTVQMARELRSHSGGQMSCGSDTEETIREIWAQVLEFPISRVSLDTSFFRLGGDSIYAIQVMRRCKDRGIFVTTQDVLANPTVTQLAAIANPLQLEETGTSAVSSFIPLEQSAQGPEYFSVDFYLLPFPRDNVQHVGRCSPFQERIYRAFHSRPYKPYIFHTFIELTNPPDDPGRLVEIWNQVTERHDMLRAAFISVPSVTGVLQVVLKRHPADAAAVPVISEQDALEHCEAHLGTIRSRMFTDNSPPLSLRVYVSHKKRAYVHLIMSHILIDHVSFAHILSDWQCFYQGKESSLNASLANFGCYISHLFDHRNIETSNGFWTNTLREAEPCLFVPAEDVRKMEKALALWDMGSVKFTLEMTSEREAFCQDEGNLDVVFGHLVSDRDLDIPSAEVMVGPMLSVIIGRVQFKHSSSLLESMRELQAHNIRALGHTTYDLAHVENHLGLGAGGLFDTLVNIGKVKYRGDDVHHPKAFRSISKRDPHEQNVVLAFNEGPSRLDAEITYYKHILDAQKVAKMPGIYCQILDGLSSGRLRTLMDVKRLGLGSNGTST
ncbi:NRPS protein [Diaporthe australafricana]|uniref:NRPS protein n=1 Tax=Diaporthe australafricana TaxID=127596 RepID=A0ABR3XWL6_9PEZI